MKSHRICIRLTNEQKKMIDQKQREYELNYTDLLIHAVKRLPRIKK